MSDRLDDLYFDWLYDKAGLYKRGSNRTYFKLMRMLHSKEFRWTSVGDKSRSDDGTDLRWQFVRDARLRKVPAEWMYRPCTVLELMMGVARRLSVLTDGEPQAWFIQLLDNLHVSHNTDAYFDGQITEIDEKLERLVWRTYSSNGDGGLFPLNFPRSDQRQVEIWYQMNAWLLERS